MPGYLTLIFVFQLMGELIAGALAIPIPGPVIGMVLMFLYLVIRGQIPETLGTTAGALLKYMSVLFVPAGAGVMMYLPLLEKEALPIAGALIVSTVITIAVTAWIMQKLSKELVDD